MVMMALGFLGSVRTVANLPRRPAGSRYPAPPAGEARGDRGTLGHSRPGALDAVRDPTAGPGAQRRRDRDPLSRQRDPDALAQWHCAGPERLSRRPAPTVLPVFFAFRLMVGIGFLMLGVIIAGWLLHWQGRLFITAWFLRFCQWAAPLGFVAVLSGWTVTEVGRQPWTVFGLLRTAQSVSPSLTGPRRNGVVSYLHGPLPHDVSGGRRGDGPPDPPRLCGGGAPEPPIAALRPHAPFAATAAE